MQMKHVARHSWVSGIMVAWMYICLSRERERQRERDRKRAANCNLPLHGSVIWFTHLSLPWLRVGSSLIPINDAHCSSSSSDDHKDCFPPQKGLACSRSSGCFDHKPGIMGVFFLIGRPDLKVFLFSHRSIFFVCVPCYHIADLQCAG